MFQLGFDFDPLLRRLAKKTFNHGNPALRDRELFLRQRNIASREPGSGHLQSDETGLHLGAQEFAAVMRRLLPQMLNFAFDIAHLSAPTTARLILAPQYRAHGFHQPFGCIRLLQKANWL